VPEEFRSKQVVKLPGGAATPEFKDLMLKLRASRP
jgi:hypothetical protein